MTLPVLRTARLTLRPFDSQRDADAILEVFGDEEINRFLPWWPVRNPDEAQRLFDERLADRYDVDNTYRYAICINPDNRPVGYIHLDGTGAHDLGYALLARFHHQGFMTEAGEALLSQAKRDGIPFATATHDRLNPASGRVMRRLGMTYRYSYEERWQPKDTLVTFRMWQLNLADPAAPEYHAYRDTATVSMVETEL